MSDAAAFRDNVVVVTGASAGIGAELARQLAAGGARLALAARDAARLEEVAAECRARGGRALAVPTDVGEEAQCAALVERAVAEYGRLDTLVNNAGISMWARFDEITDLSIFERVMRVNYLGSVYCTHHALPHLKRSRGRIVGVSSLTGKTGVPTRSGYAASKHAMAGFFDSLRIELDGTRRVRDHDLPGVRGHRDPRAGVRAGRDAAGGGEQPGARARGDDRGGVRPPDRGGVGGAQARGGDDGAREGGDVAQADRARRRGPDREEGDRGREVRGGGERTGSPDWMLLFRITTCGVSQLFLNSAFLQDRREQ